LVPDFLFSLITLSINVYSESGKDIDVVVQEARDTLQRYSHVEQELLQRKQRLSLKQPEIERCLDAVNLLIEKQDDEDDVELDFSLADQVYARAKLQKAGYVGLWLGAGVMVEYSLDEAKELLEEQLSSAKKQLETLTKDLEYVRDQVTTSEVTLARIYNHSVGMKRNKGT
jgi:prefoldin subunit 5